MALVPCRECGKEVSEEAKICPYCGIKTPSKARRKRKQIITIIIFIAFLSMSALGYYHNVNQSPMAADGTPIATPKIQKTLPVKEQIVQKDYKEKIKEMLDSGQSVGEISKKTGIRRDEIRKIKKDDANK